MPRTWLIILLGAVELIILTMVGFHFLHREDKEGRVLPQKNEGAEREEKECKRSGCSGELCTDEEATFSVCEWRSEYGCFEKAECRRQSDGQCRFTETEELASCLASGKTDLKQ